MSINLVTYANQTVTPTNDAIIYERAIDQNGIFYGCNVTVTSNTVNITGGYGIVCGREFVINSDSLTVTLAPSGTLDGRLYVRLDLADADAPIQLLTVTGNTLPALVQDDDVNYTNGVYEMELATFTVGVSALSDVVETFETISGLRGTVNEVQEFLNRNVQQNNPQVVGKWGNNTLYRVTVEGTISSGLTNNTPRNILEIVSGSIKIIDFSFVVMNTGGSYQQTYYVSGSDYLVAYIQQGYLKIVCGNATVLREQPFTFTYEYIVTA